MYLSAGLSHPTQTRLQRKAAVRREFQTCKVKAEQREVTWSLPACSSQFLLSPAAGGISECVWGKLLGLKPFRRPRRLGLMCTNMEYLSPCGQETCTEYLHS